MSPATFPVRFTTKEIRMEWMIGVESYVFLVMTVVSDLCVMNARRIRRLSFDSSMSVFTI